MKNLNKLKYINIKKRMYFSSVAFIAFLSASSLTRAMDGEEIDKQSTPIIQSSGKDNFNEPANTHCECARSLSNFSKLKIDEATFEMVDKIEGVLDVCSMGLKVFVKAESAQNIEQYKRKLKTGNAAGRVLWGLWKLYETRDVKHLGLSLRGLVNLLSIGVEGEIPTLRSKIKEEKKTKEEGEIRLNEAVKSNAAHYETLSEILEKAKKQTSEAQNSLIILSKGRDDELQEIDVKSAAEDALLVNLAAIPDAAEAVRKIRQTRIDNDNNSKEKINKKYETDKEIIQTQITTARLEEQNANFKLQATKGRETTLEEDIEAINKKIARFQNSVNKHDKGAYFLTVAGILGQKMLENQDKTSVDSFISNVKSALYEAAVQEPGKTVQYGKEVGELLYSLGSSSSAFLPTNM